MKRFRFRTRDVDQLAPGIAPPGAPTIGTATAGNAQATVTFTAPGDIGGGPITGYRATSTPGGIIGTAASSPITVTGLTNGVAYTFTVAAQNAGGFGSESAASNSVTPTAATDPNFASVVSLLPLNGTQGSTTFTDIRSKTWTRTSTAVITTTQSQFGGASLDLTTSGSDCISTTTNPVDFAFPGQFTIECWLRRADVGASTVLFSAPVTNGFSTRLDPNGVLVVYPNNGGDLITSASSALVTNTWQHIAITRDASNVIRAFVAGTQVGSATNVISFAQPTAFVLGAEDTAGTASINGFIDDFRVTKGVARYTANFTPPTAAFPTS